MCEGSMLALFFLTKLEFSFLTQVVCNKIFLDKSWQPTSDARFNE